MVELPKMELLAALQMDEDFEASVDDNTLHVSRLGLRFHFFDIPVQAWADRLEMMMQL
jgi:hypothetical protein